MKVIFFPKLPDFRKNIAVLEGSQALPVCPSGKNNVKVKMSVECWRNGADGGKQKDFVHQNYLMGWHGISNPRLRG